MIGGMRSESKHLAYCTLKLDYANCHVSIFLYVITISSEESYINAIKAGLSFAASAHRTVVLYKLARVIYGRGVLYWHAP